MGVVLRTGNRADAVRGFNGAQDLLICLDAAGDRIERVLLRDSQDNEPYVGHVRDDLWLGKTPTGGHERCFGIWGAEQDRFGVTTGVVDEPFPDEGRAKGIGVRRFVAEYERCHVS